NDERMKSGAPPLRENATLTRAAKMRADVILRHQNFSHQDPYEHIQLDTVLPMVQYPFRYASENIGMGDFSARAFVNGFMNSPRHKANLLNPELQETGVALVTGAYKQYWVNIAVQLFAIPATEEQYLGYRKEDIAQYKQLINDLNQQLALTEDRISHQIGDKEYYEGWQKILIRQHEILVTLYNTMQENQPFVKNLVSLISEYNTNWSRTPKI
ncbi:MAG: CAP domain-containing protein, partial [Candidatus Gottesmanbacteria bacterium]|nr:CAP domain-containing protein [Candidatus Gottesmanbacteria bacterium]